MGDRKAWQVKRDPREDLEGKEVRQWNAERQAAKADAAITAVWDLRHALSLTGSRYHGKRYDFASEINALQQPHRRRLLNELVSLRQDLCRLPLDDLIDDETMPPFATIGVSVRVLTDAVQSGALQNAVCDTVSLVGGLGDLIRLREHLIDLSLDELRAARLEELRQLDDREVLGPMRGSDG